MAWWSDLGTVVGGPQTGEEEVPWWSGLGSLVAEPESGGQGIAGPQVPPLESTYTPAELPADTTYGGRHVLTAPPFESPRPSAGSIMGVPLESFNRWQAEMESLPPGSPEREAMARILAPMRQAMAQHIRDTQEAARRGLSPIQHAASQDPVQAGIESLPVVARGAAMGMLGIGKTVGNIAGEVRGTDPDGQRARDRSDKVNRVWEFQQGLNRAYDRESYLAENIGPRWSENVGMVSEFIPQSLLTGKAGGIKAIAALYGATSFDESLTEAKDSGLSDTKAALYASGTAALEAGIMLAFGAAGKSLGVQTAEEVLSSKSLAQSLLTRSGLKQALLGAAGEAVEEGLTQATQQVWSDIMGAGSVEGIGENVLRALELGGLGGGVAHGVARAAQALESSVNLIKKAEADEPVSRGDLEKAGIPSRGTSAKSRKQVAKEFAEEQRDHAAAAWSDPPPGTRVRIEQGEGAARRREQVAQRLEMEESERLAQIPMPGEQPQETLQSIPTQAETPADTPPAADTPADTPESSGDSVHFLSDPNIDWTESDQKTLGRHFRNFRRRKDFDSEILQELESLEPRTALDVIAEAEYRADADNERLAAIRLEYNTLFPDKRGVTNRARLAEMRGGDPNQIPGFDEMVQALRDGEYPHLAAEASSLGHGNLEAGLFSILQGGIKQFEKIPVDQYLPDVLDELRRFQESEPAPAPVREGPSEWSDPALLAARPEQPAQVQQAVPDGEAPQALAAETASDLNRTAEAVNAKRWYHGSGTEGLTPETVSVTSTRPENLFGMGIYLTDSKEIADGYAKARGKQRGRRKSTTYQVQVHVNRVLDLESPADPLFVDVVRRNSQYNDELREAVEKAAGKQGATNESVFLALSEEVELVSHQQEIPASEFTEVFQGIAHGLREAGIDALSHTGGKRTGKSPHEVLILLDPNSEFSNTDTPPLRQIVSMTAEGEERTPLTSPEQPSSTKAASEPPSGEGAADESFSLARQPATRPRDPASEVESIPTHQPDLIPDLWRDSLEGQQGLFDEPASGEQDLGGAHYARHSPLLQPEMAAPRTVTPKSLRAIITDLSKAMNVPVRFGRLRSAGRKMGGYFLPQENLIAIRRANDLPVASHEFGHKLDAMFQLSANKNIARELERLGDPETPGSMSSWTKSKTKSYQRGEGVAEFVRYWLVEPTTAQRQSPHTFSEFESILDANPDLATLLRQAQEDIHLWRTADPQARLRSHISRGDDPTKPRYELKHLVRDLVDNLHIFRLVVDDAKLARPNLPASENPYILARNLRGSYGMASTFVRRGVADFRTKEVTLGTSLEDALRPVSGRIRDFGDWIVAKRAQELHARGAETGLVPSDVDATAAKFDHDPQFHEAFDRIKQWNDALLQYAIDAGLVTEESGQAMRELSANYVPFHRIFEVGAGESPSSFAQSGGSGAGLNLGRPASLRRMKEEGSTRQIIDPLETMVKNAYTIITAAEKAAINHAIARLASVPGMGKWVERIRSPMQRMEFDIQEIRKQLEEELGIDPETIPDDLLLAVYRPASHTPQGENIIRIPRDGKYEYYRLNRDLYDTFHALDQESSGMLIRYLSAPAQTLRAGVALEPGFSVFNAVRDTFGAAVLSKVGALPFETTARGVAAMVGNPQLVAEWSAAGGQSAVEATFFDRKKMQQYLAEKIAKDLTPAERALVVAKSPLTALRWATGVFEESTRIGEYQLYYDHLRRSGMAAGDARRMAAFEARDRQDFGKGGAKTKVLRRLAPFWNAALQGNVKVIENHRDHPLRTALQGTAFVTIPTMALLAINWDDQDYWDRPWWERDAFWLFPIGKDDAGHTRFLRLPKPFLLGLMYGVLPERILGWAKTNNPAALGDFPGVLFRELVTSAMPIPQAVSVIVENSVGDQGWSFFRNRPIVPDSLADYPPEMQWTEHTTELAKRVGKSLGMSPLKIDHFIEQTTGGMGQILSGRKSLASRFFTRDLALSSQPLQDFYEIRDQLVKETTAARVNQTGQRPVAMTMFEQAARRISDLRKQAYNLPQSVERARIENEAFTIARQTVEAYRSDPAPRQAVAERRETLNKGLRRTIRRGKDESPMDWRKRQESHAEYRRRIQQELAELEKLP